MISPILQDDAFLKDVQNAPNNQLNLWWLGQSGYLIRWQNHHLLLDPYLSDSLTRKYAGTDKPHIRMTERIIEPSQLNFIDAVTSTHNHTDHLDAETLGPLLSANPALKVIVPRANLAFAADRLGVQASRLTPIQTNGASIQIGPFTFFAVPSAHETLQVDGNGDHKFIGYIIQVAGKTLYHSGDACLYDGLVNTLKSWRIDVAFLPINGRDPARGVAGNFTAHEAVDLGEEIGAKCVIPCHYHMFEFNSVSPDAFKIYALHRNVPHRILQCGERLSI